MLDPSHNNQQQPNPGRVAWGMLCHSPQSVSLAAHVGSSLLHGIWTLSSCIFQNICPAGLLVPCLCYSVFRAPGNIRCVLPAEHSAFAAICPSIHPQPCLPELVPTVLGQGLALLTSGVVPGAAGINSDENLSSQFTGSTRLKLTPTVPNGQCLWWLWLVSRRANPLRWDQSLL